MNIDHSAISELLRDAAAREIMPLWQNLQHHQIEQKRPGDLVTVADQACEQRLSRELQGLMPGSLVLGEEAVHRDASIMGVLQSDRPVWVIDPLDGTSNFAAGDGPIAVMLCLVQQGETLAAWIYDPVEDSLLQAERGAGAQLDGQPVSLPAFRGETAAIRGALSDRYLPPELRPAARAGARKLGPTRASGCAGHDYRAMMRGEYQFVFYYRTLVWDHAPGVLIIREAGAHAARFDGSPYQATSVGTGLIAAVDERTWDRVQRVLLPTWSGELPQQD